MSQAGTGIDLDAFVNFINDFSEGAQHPGGTARRHVPPASCPPPGCDRWLCLGHQPCLAEDGPGVPLSDPRLVQLLPHSSDSASLRPGDFSYTLRALGTEAQTRNKVGI